ncbi:unnamed protein product [Cuscuta campestris]|uniref:CCHC-type domain-containing protein n=1 Tax=Cuscuta campestris TaxID=132261 RepID=A0A484MLN3_9ASTE|nr:unnamed protein product [Cuscuta campestris]
MKKIGDTLIPKDEDEYDEADLKKAQLNATAINFLYCAVNANDYQKISRCQTANQMRNKLMITYEGTPQVRESKIDLLTHEYELFAMKENELVEDMFGRFSNIINDLDMLGKTLTDKELVRKILRSLTKEWESKVNSIYEGRDYNVITYDGLREIGDSDSDSDSDNDSSTSCDILVECFNEFLKHELNKSKKKNTLKCHKCGKLGHRKFECPKLKKMSKQDEFAYFSWKYDEPSKDDCLIALEEQDGWSGYDDWKIIMEAHLYALHDCMWMVLEDGPLKIQMENRERDPKNPDVVQYIPKPKEKWDDRDCKKHNMDNVAKGAIFKTLDPITFSKIKHLKTAMEIWQGLRKLCEGSEDLRKQKIEVLLEKFKSFKMLPEESFDLLDERFHKILNDLASLNHVLSPKEKNVRLLRSLPAEWYTKATAMEEGRNLENYTVQAENESLSEKVRSLNKDLGIRKSKEAVDKLLETTKKKGREGLGFDPSSSKRKGRTTFIPPKPTAKPNKQKGKEKEKPTEVPKKAVSYVEGLNYNLLSISQICDKGYSLEFCKDMASLKNISTNEVILTGKRIRNIYEVMWDDVKEACLISKVDKSSKPDHEVPDLSDKDEEVNEGDRMKPTEVIPFGSLPLKTSRRNPDSDSAEPTGNHGQPSEILDLSHGDNSGNGDQVPTNLETPTNSILQPEAELDQPVNPNQHNLRWLKAQIFTFKKMEAKCSSPAFYEAYLEMIDAQELSEFLHMEIRLKYEEEVLEFYRNGRVTTIQSKKNPQRSIQVIKSTVGGTAVKISQKKMKKKLHLANSGIDIGKLSSKNLDWNTIGISGQIPYCPAKKTDLENDYKLVLEVVIACKKYDARYWLYYLSSKGENKASSIAEDEGSSDDVLIVSQKKSSKRKQVASTSHSAEEPHTLAVVNLDEEEEVSTLGELQKKKKRRISSPSTSGNSNLENSVQNQPQDSPQDLNEEFYQDQNLPSPPSQALADEVDKFMQLYYVSRAWKVGNSTDQLLEWDQQLKNDKIIKKCLGLPINCHCEQILDEQWDWKKTNEDVLLEHLSTSSAPEFEVDYDYVAVYTPMFVNSAGNQTADQAKNITIEAHADLEAEAEDFTVHEIITTTCEISNQTEPEILEKSSANLEKFTPLETTVEEANEEPAVEAQRSRRSSSTSTFPDEMPESWTRKVQGLIESALESQKALIRQDLEKPMPLTAIFNSKKLWRSSSRLPPSQPVFRSKCHFSRWTSHQPWQCPQQNIVVSQDYLKVLADNQKEAFKIFKHFETLTAQRKLQVIVQHKSLPPIPRHPIQAKEGELEYIATHLNMTELILEARQSNPENSVQHLSNNEFDGTEALGTIASLFTNEARQKERYDNLKRIKAECGVMQGIGEAAESSQRKRN